MQVFVWPARLIFIRIWQESATWVEHALRHGVSQATRMTWQWLKLTDRIEEC